MKLGIVGCGGHGLWHALMALQSGWEISALYDPIYGAMEGVVAELKPFGSPPRPHRSLESLLNSKHVDAVVIASVDDEHARQLMQAVEAGKHVLVEKPIGTTEDDLRLARQALTRAANLGVVVTSCFPRRFDPPYLTVRRMLPEWQEQYGPLSLLGLDFSYPRAAAEWKGRRSLLLDHVPHELDYLRFLLGPQAMTAIRLADSDDEYIVVGHLQSGVSFVFSGKRKLREADLQHGKIYPEFIELRFARCTVRVNTHQGTVSFSEHGSQYEGSNESPSLYRTDYDQRLRGVMTNFGEAIAGQANNYLTADEMQHNAVAVTRLAVTGLYDDHYKD